MEIKYLGHSSFLIKSKDARLVTDPFDPEKVGMRFPKTEADIVTVSHGHSDHNRTDLIGNEPLIIDMPGEFEKQSIRIFGYLSYHDKKKGVERGENIIYKIEVEGISILHCGDMGVVPTEELVDQIDGVDVIMIPVGGKYTIDSNEAVEVIKKFEPAIIIPMHYSLSGKETESGLAPLSDFLKKMGGEGIVPIPKLVLKKDQLIDDMKVVLLES